MSDRPIPRPKVEWAERKVQPRHNITYPVHASIARNVATAPAGLQYDLEYEARRRLKY